MYVCADWSKGGCENIVCMCVQIGLKVSVRTCMYVCADWSKGECENMYVCVCRLV